MQVIDTIEHEPYPHLNFEICSAVRTEMTTQFKPLFTSLVIMIQDMPGYGSVSDKMRRHDILQVAQSVCDVVINNPSNWPQPSNVGQHADLWEALDKISKLMEDI